MNRNKKNKFLVAGAVVGLLIFFHYLGAMRPIESAVSTMVEPALTRLYGFGTDLRSLYRRQTGIINYSNELDISREKVRQLTAENAKLKLVEEENNILRGHLGFLSKHDYKYELANVIARNEAGEDSDYAQSIILDKGENDGIKIGLAAVSSEGMVVGKISEVRPESSIVRLTTNSMCKMAATVQNSSKTTGLTKGNLGLTINMDYIPQSESVKSGDIVISSGLEEGIPRGLVIGKVTEIKKSSNELWQNATIEPLADAGNLVIVSVVIP